MFTIPDEPEIGVKSRLKSVQRIFALAGGAIAAANRLGTFPTSRA